jgi:hypothetical protein
MTKRICVLGFLCAWLAVDAHAADDSLPVALDLVLVHEFKIPSGESWGPVAIVLAAGGWRIGSARGEFASESQLRQVLHGLASVELGGRCSGWFSGPTAYPCGFSLRDIDMAGAVAERYAAIAVDEQSVAAVRESPELEVPAEMHASQPLSPRPDAEHFVGLRMPPTYLGDKSQTYGGTLSFEIRALSNVLVRSRFDRNSGLVILRSRLAGQRS